VASTSSLGGWGPWGLASRSGLDLLDSPSFLDQAVVARGLGEPLGDSVSAGSSEAGGGRRSFLGVPSGAARAAASNRSRLRSSVGRVGGMSAALMASSPLVELKVPATARAMAVVGLWKPSSSHAWPSPRIPVRSRAFESSANSTYRHPTRTLLGERVRRCRERGGGFR